MFRKLFLISLLLLIPFLGLATLRRNKESAFMPVFLGKYAKYAKWIQAQAKHETGNFQSDAFKNLNNAFGMKDALIRPQLGKDVESQYRKYKSLAESIKDFLIYLDFVNFPTDITRVEDYVLELKKRDYFTDSYENYLKGVKSWL